MKKFLFTIFALIASFAGLIGTSLLTSDAFAEEYICEPSSNPLVTRWCEGVPANPDFTSGRDSMVAYVSTVVSNIYSIITDVAAYIAVVLVMWGGFQYITSAGDPGKNIKGRKTIINSLIGIVIVKGSDILFKIVKGVLIGANDKATSISDLAGHISSKFFFWSGVVATIMMIWGALQYTASAGDPGKATKAKKTIISSAIGLAIVMFAAILVSIVINTLDVNN